MRKSTITTLLSLIVSGIFAQDLISKIPGDANAVATINTGKLLQLMPVEEWNKSNFGKKLLEMSAKGANESMTSLNDIGIDFSKNAYYFHTENDSVHYNYVLVSLASADRFDALFKDKPVQHPGNDVRIIADNDSSGFMIWNRQQLLYVKGTLKERYFQDYEVARRHGLFYQRYDTMMLADSLAPPPPPLEDLNNPAADTATIIMEEPLEEKEPVTEKKAKPKNQKKSQATDKKGPQSKKTKAKKEKPVEEPVIEETPVYEDTYVTVDTAVNEYSPSPYDNDYLIKKSILASITRAASMELFSKNPERSILSNLQYAKSVDHHAVATLWVERPMEFYYNLLPASLFYRGRADASLMRAMNGFGSKSFTAKIFMEDKQIRLHSEAELSDEMAAMQRQFYSRKLNKQMLKYINTDSVLGYMSWAVDTKAYLDNFPRLLENAFGAMGAGLGGDEYALASEFISFLIDEDAISKLVKGDGLLLFNGLYQQQTTYTDYVYDENFNGTPVEKTRTDTLPQFLLMLSSEENNFERKLIDYGIRKEVVKQREGFFELAIPRSPMKFFFMNKDGVFFLTNAITDMERIRAGTFESKISKQEKRVLLDHNYSMFINPEKIAGRIGAIEIGATETLSSAMNTFRQVGNVRATMHPLKGTTATGDLTIDVPENKTNSLKYLFEIFDSLLK